MATKNPTPETLPGLIGGRYVIERELGQGGMATVYLARDLRDESRVAVKVLLPDLTASIGADRFLREIELGKVLQHPGIVGVLDSGEVNGQLYYAMPFIQGESLRDRLDRERQLTIEDTLELTRQVAEALDYAHSKGVIHRDIKPENILVDGNRAWVADFGIARAVTVAGGEKLTKTGMAVGTPVYMSPEQALGSKDATPQSDIYSLGCVVYEMLVGNPPFSAANPMALLAKHSLENVPSIRIVRQSVPEELEGAIFCALDKTPADRFRSAAQFVAALKGEVPLPKRNRTGNPGMRADAEAAPVPAPRRSRTVLALAAAGAVLVAGVGGYALWRTAGVASAASASRAGTDSDPSNIAVLYFEDGSPQRDLGYLADGLTEAIIKELSGVRQLRVISRNGVSPFKGRADVAPDSVGRALRVGTVVTGKVTPAGDELRVDVSLIDAATNEEIGNARVEQPRDSLLALEDELAGDIANVLRRQLGQEIQTLESRTGTRDARAWEAMERAKQTIAAAEPLVREGNVQAASRQLETADGELAAVERLDPKWTAPIVQRGQLAYQRSRLIAPVDRSQLPPLLEAATGHATRALALNAADADALELRGTVRYWSWLVNAAPDPSAATQLLVGAEKDLTDATKANPQQAGAWNTLSHLLLAKARISEGKVAADRAYDADPYLTNIDQTIWRRFQASLDLGNRAEATKACELGQRRFPDNFRFTECRLWLYSLEGQTPQAPEVWAAYEAYVERSPTNLRAFNELKGKMMVALGLVRAGLPDSARSLAVSTQGKADSEIDPGGEMIYLRSIVHAQIATPKDIDDAIRTLNRFLAMQPQQGGDEGSEDESWWMKKIKDDPRYKALVSR